MKRTVEMINEASKTPEVFIKQCTDEYLNEIKSAAKRIAEDEKIKIVAIAGPSASGKTTTAHILMKELHSLGQSISVISLDDFYKLRKDLPVLPDGSLDIESVNSLDKSLIEKCFGEYLKTGKTYIPKYDFKTKKREKKGYLLERKENSVIIVEGLHALNPELSKLVPEENIFKIYISLNKSVEDNDGMPILTARQIRLIRRVIRDDKFRAADIKHTLTLWNNVLEGEVKYLFPFIETADVTISTMQPFEICVYKEQFCRLRKGVDRNTPWYEYFIDTVNTLELFNSIDSSLVPEDSLIREFIG